MRDTSLVARSKMKKKSDYVALLLIMVCDVKKIAKKSKKTPKTDEIGEKSIKNQ